MFYVTTPVITTTTRLYPCRLSRLPYLHFNAPEKVSFPLIKLHLGSNNTQPENEPLRAIVHVFIRDTVKYVAEWGDWMEITRGTHSLSRCGEWGMLVNQKISLRITRDQRNKRRGLEARTSETEEEKRKWKKKKKYKREAEAVERDNKNWNTPSEHPYKRLFSSEEHQ